MSLAFKLRSEFTPKGDQPAAIESLIKSFEAGVQYQTLLGITGSGKTFTVANLIQKLQKPTLIMAPNKTLAAQLYSEMKDLFPENAVAFFVSYYDYYQPEAYLPTTDTFIEKDAIINDQIDRMRHAATQSLLSRSDVIIIASVSCIYGIGSAETYSGLLINIVKGEELRRDNLLRQLVDIQYERNDTDFHRGTFRVRGDVVEIFPVYEEALAIRVEFFGDEVDGIHEVDPLRGKVLGSLDKYSIFPGSHYVTPRQQLDRAISGIRTELKERLEFYDREGRFLEKQRIQQRTMYDLEMLEQMGFVQGIENYSRHLSQRPPGDPPPTLIDYFPKDFLLIMDESHQTVPQVGAMYRGDRSRKETLVEYGFRLPSALDNRPLKFDEFEQHMHRTVFVSATPGEYELKKSEGVVVEQVHRSARSRNLRTPGGRPGRRLVGGDSRARQEGRTCLGDDADQAHGRRAHRLLHGARRARALPALRHRHAGARGNLARPARWRVRRAGRHQPAARRLGLARGEPRRDLGRRQRGLLAQRAVADSNHRACGAQPKRASLHVRRPHHRRHEAGDG
jgi:excinuclease ABC subunit B